MEYDIDFYKHFAWLRKVRPFPFACLLIIRSYCTKTAQICCFFCSCTVVALQHNYGYHDNLGGQHVLIVSCAVRCAAKYAACTLV